MQLIDNMSTMVIHESSDLDKRGVDDKRDTSHLPFSQAFKGWLNKTARKSKNPVDKRLISMIKLMDDARPQSDPPFFSKSVESEAFQVREN